MSIKINNLIKFLNPERSTFQEFIFRDISGLYKYNKDLTGTFSKIYLNIKNLPENYLEDTCKKLELQTNNLILCHQYLFNAILNLNNNDVKSILADIAGIITTEANFFDVVKDDITNIDHNIVLILLKNLDFKIIEGSFDIDYKINKLENVVDWRARRDKSDQNILDKNNFLLTYLQLLVDYINSNPAILNENYTDYYSYLYTIANLEKELKNLYNANAIYKDILIYTENKIVYNTNIDINNFDIKLKNQLYKINDFEKILLQLENFVNFFNNSFKINKGKIILYLDNKETNIELDKKILKDLFKNNLKPFSDFIIDFKEKMYILINYILINPKFDIIDKNKIKKEVTIKELEEEIEKFKNIRYKLRSLQDKMNELYPNNNY